MGEEGTLKSILASKSGISRVCRGHQVTTLTADLQRTDVYKLFTIGAVGRCSHQPVHGLNVDRVL